MPLGSIFYAGELCIVLDELRLGIVPAICVEGTYVSRLGLSDTP